MTRISALICMLVFCATPTLSNTVLLNCSFERACGTSGCHDNAITLNLVRDDFYALFLQGTDVRVRVQHSASGPLRIWSGTGYEPADTGEDGGYTSLVLHDNGDAVLMSAVALPLGGGTLESGQFLGHCEILSQ